MVILAVALAYWSKSRNLLIASLVVLTDWFLSNFFTLRFGDGGVNYIAPMNFLIFAFFTYLYSRKDYKGRAFYRPLIFFYAFYLLINLWHLGGRIFFPETLIATSWYVYRASNIVFVLIMLTLYSYSIIKGIGNRSEGGLMAVFEDYVLRIKAFNKEYNQLVRGVEGETMDATRAFFYSFSKHILKKPVDEPKQGAGQAEQE